MPIKAHACKSGKTIFSGALLVAFHSIALNAMAQPQQAGTSERIAQLYGAADYRTVARLGSARLLAEPGNHQLRYMVANSFAWTGRFPEAIENYKALQGTDHASRADFGLASVYRWNGLPGLAAPLYRQVLAADSGNRDASEGLAYAMRDLRPQTQARIVRSSDSLDTEREAVTLGQRWTDPSLRHTFELEAGALQDERHAAKVNQRDLTLRYAGVAQPLKPRMEVSLQQQPHDTLFAAAEVQLPDTPITIGAGRVNWGKMAFDPHALQAGLAANHAGIRAGVPTDIGMWRVGYRAYRVSDDNLIQDAVVQYTPSWQPVNISQVKVFIGFEGRKARFHSPAYWSPADGSYLGTLGVSAEWLDRSWERNIIVQYGVPLGGEAENSYSANAGVKHWVNESLAIGFNLFAQKSQRSGAYRANTVMLSIQGLW